MPAHSLRFPLPYDLGEARSDPGCLKHLEQDRSHITEAASVFELAFGTELCQQLIASPPSPAIHDALLQHLDPLFPRALYLRYEHASRIFLLAICPWGIIVNFENINDIWQHTTMYVSYDACASRTPEDGQAKAVRDLVRLYRSALPGRGQCWAYPDSENPSDSGRLKCRVHRSGPLGLQENRGARLSGTEVDLALA